MEDWGFDSQDKFEVMMEIAEGFYIKIDGREAAAIETIEEIVEIVKKRGVNKNGNYIFYNYNRNGNLC